MVHYFLPRGYFDDLRPQESILIKKVFFILTRHGIKINVGYFWSIQAKDWALGRSNFWPACGLLQTAWVESILKYGTKSLLKGYAEKTIEEKHALKSLFVGFNEVFFERCGVATGDQINYSFIFMRFSSDYRVMIIWHIIRIDQSYIHDRCTALLQWVASSRWNNTYL